LQEVKAKQQREKEDKKVQLLKEKEDEKMRLKIEKAQQKVAKEQEFKKHQEEKENIQKEIFDKEQEKEKISLKKQKEKFSRKDNLEKELICVKSNKTEPDDVIYADGEFMKDSKRDLLQTPAVPDILTAESTDNQTAESLQAEMALRSRSPGGGGGGYVSVVSNDEMQSFQQNGYHDDEDIDFAPQNGYHYPEDDTEVPRKGKKSGAPKVDLMGKIAAIKNMKIPSPEEIKEGYLNSAFHKSLHQPLMVKAKVEKIDVQKARQAVTQEKTPLQLGNIESLSDIPIPTMRKSKQVQEENAETNGNDEPQEPKTLVETLIPKSLMEQNILTAVKENLDPEELERNQTLTRTKTPAQLAQINSISEFPVPDKIKNLLTSSGAGDKVAPERKKRRHSDIEPKSVEPFSMYSTLPRSLRETKLVTNVKVEEDEETLKARQDLVNTQTPAQLAQICSIADIPVPTRLSKMVTRGQSRSETRASSRAKSSDHVAMASNTTSMSKVNINEMFSTLPKSLTMELAVVSKINKNQDEIEKRRTLCQEKSPAELGNIGSLSDLPIPAPIQNIFFSKTDAPSKPKRNSKDYAEKRKRNLTTGATLPSDFLPESWKETKLLVRSKVEEDEDVLKSRQQLVETKTPAELGAISGLSDLPIPTRIQTLVRPKKRTLKSTEEKQMSKKVSGSAKSLPEMSGFSIPSSLKSELIVTSVVEDPEIVARNKELIKNKSVSELSQIRDIAEFPIPEKIENFFKQKSGPSSVKMTSSVYENGVSECSSERPTSPTSFKDSIYGTLSRSMKEQQLLVNTKLQDQEMVRERQELVRTKSPAELSQISGVNDLPIPTPVENLLKRKSEPGSPVAPPRKWKAEDIYESLPGSLKSELVVRTREMEDMDELERRREVIRTQSPAQLSQIHGFSDIPVPKFIEQKFASKPESVKIEKPTPTETDIEVSNLPLSERIYGTLPASLKDTKLLVKAECEDPEIQAARAEVVKSKSVHELSQVTSLADVPIPDVIENFLKKKEKPLAPAERKKKFKDQMKSQSTLSLSQSLYGSLPRSLKQDLLVKARVEDPDILAERRAIVASKSVSELSQITSLSDIPIPTTLSRAFHKSMERLNGMKPPQPVDSVDDSRPISPGARSIQENLYATLPRSLKSEILVKSVVEDQETQMQNMALTQSKSVSELSQIKSLSEFPIPDRIEKLINNRSDTTNNKNLNQTPEQLSLADSRPMSQASRRGMNDIYASLPRSLTDQLIVRTKVEADEEVLAARQALVESKSPVELSEIHSLAELPIPSRIEAWLSGNKVQENGERSDEASPMILPRNKKELHEAVYRTLPTSLVQPCVVRSKVEDPNILLERQQLQQTKSIHELSKIRNLNEMPVPGNLFTLPDVPLPKVKSLLNIIARPPQRSPRVQNGRSQTYQSYESAQSETPLSTPAVEEREQHDLGYESLPAPPNSSTPPPPPPPAEDEDDQFNLADQIRATPERSLKGKKKKNRRSHEIHEDMVEDVPPPLPPKKLSPSPIKGLSLERQPSEEEEIEAIPVKNKLRSQFGTDVSQQPLPPKRERQSGSHEPREISEKDLSLFGSNELIYVPGSPLPIMIEEAEEEEDEVEDDMVRDTPDQDDNIRNSPPSAPPRSKVARTSMTFFNEHFIDTENSSNIFNIDPLVISPPIATLRKKSKKSKSEPVFEPCAFDDPVLDVDPNYDEPNLIINQHSVEPDETPVTLPRKRRGKIKANLSTSRADVSPSPPPRLYATLPPRKKNSTLLDASMSSPQVEERIQSRPLPAPPAPPRNMKKKSASIEESEGRASRNSDRSYGDVTCTENFRTCADTLNTSKTLRAPSSRDEDDITLAESVVDSLVSCAETLVDDNDNMETCVDTLTGGDEFLSDEDVDNPYPSVNFDRAGASIMEEDRPGRSMDKKRDVKKSESGRRLEEGTQQLSLELMHHVESLKTTLDNMSNRLGTRSRSRSHSKTRNNNKDSL